MIAIDFQPADRQLRQFAALLAIACAAAAWWFTISTSWFYVVIGLALSISLVGYLKPQLFKPIFVASSIVTAPIGRFTAELAMLVIYFGIVTPIGLLQRLLGRDPLKKQIDRKLDTYWEDISSPSEKRTYLRQY